MPTIGPLGPVDNVDYRHWTGATPTPGPFEWGGNIYVVIGNVNVAGVVRVFKSADGGITWANIDSPVVSVLTFARPGSAPSRIALATLSNFAGGNWTLQEFDMATDTYVAVGVVASISVLSWMDYSPATGEWRLYFYAGAPSRIFVKRWNGVDLGDVLLATGPPGWSVFMGQSISDVAGNTLIIYNETGPSEKLQYARMDVAGVVGAVTTILNVAWLPNVGMPALVAGRIIIPYRARPFVGLYQSAAIVGDDYTNPVPAFTYFTFSVNYITNATCGSDGSVWWVAATTPGFFPLDQLEMCTFDGLVAGPIQLVHDEVAAPSFPGVLGQFIHNVGPPVLTAPTNYDFVAALEYPNPGGGPQLCTSFFWQFLGGPPPCTLTVTKILAPAADPGLFNLQIDAVTLAPNVGNGGTTGAIVVAPGPHQVGETAGVGTLLANYLTVIGGDAAPDGSIVLAPGENKVATITNTRAPRTLTQLRQGGFRRMVVLVPNRFDAVLGSQAHAYARFQPHKACPEAMLYRDISWVRAPSNYIPFRKIGTVPTPLAISGDVTVLDFQVPDGYDGLIAGLFNVYTGPGFLEGNGDIQWRLMVNRVYAIHLGNIQVTLGSRQQPYPVDGGILIQSGTHVRYIVNVPNLSGGILPLNSQIECGLEGLFYARA